MQTRKKHFQPGKPIRQLLILLSVLFVSADLWAETKPIRVGRAVKISSSSALESSLAKAQETALEPFSNEKGKPAEVATKTNIFYDQANLYIVVKCHEPAVATLEAAASGNDSSAIWKDDLIELFISPHRDKNTYYHFAVNPKGARYEALMMKGAAAKVDWNPHWQASCLIQASSWTATITIPFAALETTVADTSVWWMNVCRERQATGKWQGLSWSPTGGVFNKPGNFGLLVFSNQYQHIARKFYIDYWKQTLDSLKASIEVLKEEKMRKSLPALQQMFAAKAKQVEQQTAMTKADFAKLVTSILADLDKLAPLERRVKYDLAKKQMLESLKGITAAGKQLLVYSIDDPITSKRIMPIPTIPAKPSRTLAITGCTGEYEPASFIVIPTRDVTVKVDVSDLTGKQGTIPKSAVDVRAVKRWYQSGSRNIINEGVRILTPELLLKDDNLVKVDHAKQDNFVRLNFSDGKVKWQCISNQEPDSVEKLASDKLPVRDAETLQPVKLPACIAKQFWVTVQIPKTAAPGVYQGRINLLANGKVLDYLTVKLRVLPFKLAANPLESSMYFHWSNQLYPDSIGSVHYKKRNLAQYKKELENLYAHGVDNPTIGVHFELIPLVLKLRQEIGMKNDNFYYLNTDISPIPFKRLKEIIAVAKSFGFKDVYFYGPDEARGEALKRQRPEFEGIHKAGGKVYFAGYAGCNFRDVGDLQDLLICAGKPDKQDAANWNRSGKKVFSYSNPQIGVEDPEIYRRNYGLTLLVNDYSGAMNYIYYNNWNDFNIDPWRQHNFVYPTVDGVIDTIQWEGYREGIDDLRYFATLQNAIKQAEKAGKGNEKTVIAAKAFVNDVKANFDSYKDLKALRQTIINWIIKLQ